jgi:antitoxin CptB
VNATPAQKRIHQGASFLRINHRSPSPEFADGTFRVAARMFSEPEYKRIYWASRRGMLELDLILMPFVERRLRELSDEDQQRYVTLLECEDTELFAWFMQSQRPTDAELTRIVDEIIAFSRTAST